MSASASLAAFLVGAPLVYVDYHEYHGPNRIPVAGTEYPRLLTNPLDVFGDVELRAVFAAFDRSDFQEAEHIAQRLGERLYEPREAQCLAILAHGYAAWDRFDFKSAHESLDVARGKLANFASRGNWRWAEQLRTRLGENLRALEALTQVPEKPLNVPQGIPLLAWYLAAAKRLADAGKPSHALLLTYAAVERYVDLCLLVDFGLDDEKPDYGRVKSQLVLDNYSDRYDRAGEALFAKNYKRRELAGPLMFANGAQLLAALAPKRLPLSYLGPLKGLSAARNVCEYEHRFLSKPSDMKKVLGFLQHATELISQCCGSNGALEQTMRECAFPKLLAETQTIG